MYVSEGSKFHANILDLGPHKKGNKPPCTCTDSTQPDLQLLISELGHGCKAPLDSNAAVAAVRH